MTSANPAARLTTSSRTDALLTAPASLSIGSPRSDPGGRPNPSSGAAATTAW